MTRGIVFADVGFRFDNRLGKSSGTYLGN